MKIRNCAILIFFLIISFPHFLLAQNTSSDNNVTATLKVLYLGGKYDSAAVISEKHITDFNLKNDPDFWYFSGLVFKEMYKKYEKENPVSPYREKASLALQKSWANESEANIITDIKKNLTYLANTYIKDAYRLLKGDKSELTTSSDAF